MYNIKEIHYRDIYGKLIWKDDIVFRSLWGVGNELVHDSKQYIVRRVAVVDEVQHVNIELMEAAQQSVQWTGATVTAKILSLGSLLASRRFAPYANAPAADASRWALVPRKGKTMSKSDAQETVEFAIRSGLANRAHKTGITLDKSQIIIDDIMAELFSPDMVWAIQEHAQQCVHPTAAGGSDSDNNSKSGGG